MSFVMMPSCVCKSEEVVCITPACIPKIMMGGLSQTHLSMGSSWTSGQGKLELL